MPIAETPDRTVGKGCRQRERPSSVYRRGLRKRVFPRKRPDCIWHTTSPRYKISPDRVHRARVFRFTKRQKSRMSIGFAAPARDFRDRGKLFVCEELPSGGGTSISIVRRVRCTFGTRCCNGRRLAPKTVSVTNAKTIAARNRSGRNRRQRRLVHGTAADGTDNRSRTASRRERFPVCRQTKNRLQRF